MTSADLGYPALLFILTFWGFLAIAGFVTAFTKKENLRDIKKFWQRVIDPTHHHHSHEV
jgi:hypothetical protein